MASVSSVTVISQSPSSGMSAKSWAARAASSVSASSKAAGLAEQHGQPGPPRGPPGGLGHQRPRRILQLAQPGLFPADHEDLNRVVLRRCDALGPHPGREGLAGQRLGGGQPARHQRLHRPPHEHLPLKQRLAQVVGHVVKGLDLRLDRAPVPRLQQVDDQPRVTLQDEPAVARLRAARSSSVESASRRSRWPGPQ